MTGKPSVYDSWSREDLIARLSEIERPKSSHPHVKSSPSRTSKSFSFDSYQKRKIALKFCYSGWEYNGLAYQLGPTPLPTVEAVLYNALVHTRLVDPSAGFDGCGWEKCGRTDRGVSAAGQVVSLWVRSALDKKDTQSSASSGKEIAGVQPKLEAGVQQNSTGLEGEFGSMEFEDVTSSANETKSTEEQKPELAYVPLLNRVLPPTIRVLAWSPVSDDFSARFHCRFRHYKYFFSSEGLDVSRMRQAAGLLVGEHDFRNMCKLDPAKQITNFKRRVIRAELNPVDSELHDTQSWVLDLVGTAFLYHQVRHIMSILFLVGSGVEHPSIVASLLNTNSTSSYWNSKDFDQPLSVVDCKPEYQMADALPLMLWDCGYSDTDVQWRTGRETSFAIDHHSNLFKESGGGTGSQLHHQLHSIHRRSEIHTVLDQHFLAAAERYHSPLRQPFPLASANETKNFEDGMMAVPLGGGTYKRMAKYIPLLERRRQDSYEIANERWRVGKGARKEERRRNDALEEDDANE